VRCKWQSEIIAPPAEHHEQRRQEDEEHDFFDHVDSHEWFVDDHDDHDHGHGEEASVYDRIRHDIAVERHHGTTANYLFADGHVHAIPADQLSTWASEEFNFAEPER
jgi:prepilin-type processing-associated H-X9-DG protein